MAIEDIDTPLSDGWWLMRLSRKLSNRNRQQRLQRLRRYADGDPDLPVGAENCRAAFAQFQRMSRSNFSGLITSAMSSRMQANGVRTSSDNDETGDTEAWDIIERSGMQIVMADAINMMLTYGESYIMVGDINPDTEVPVVTAEDPREAITVEDPATNRTLAGLKVLHDDVTDEDLAYVLLPGRVVVASRPRKGCGLSIHINAQAWSWDEARSVDLTDRLGSLVPLVRFENKDGVGEFENHMDLIDRINHIVLQRMVISTYQAFRQRAAIGLPDTYPPGHPLAGQEVNYENVFTSDPGSFWQLPENTQMWESGQADLTPILASAKNEIQNLSAVTETPFSMFSSDAINQSATGAGLIKEGVVNKAKDRLMRINPKLNTVIALCFKWLSDPRGDLKTIRVMWEDPNMPTMAERFDAYSKSAGVPWRTGMTKILGFSPSEVDRMETERADDQMLAAAFAIPAPAPQPLPAGQQPATPGKAVANDATSAAGSGDGTNAGSGSSSVPSVSK